MGKPSASSDQISLMIRPPQGAWLTRCHMPCATHIGVAWRTTIVRQCDAVGVPCAGCSCVRLLAFGWRWVVSGAPMCQPLPMCPMCSVCPVCPECFLWLSFGPIMSYVLSACRHQSFHAGSLVHFLCPKFHCDSTEHSWNIKLQLLCVASSKNVSSVVPCGPAGTSLKLIGSFARRVILMWQESALTNLARMY